MARLLKFSILFSLIFGLILTSLTPQKTYAAPTNPESTSESTLDFTTENDPGLYHGRIVSEEQVIKDYMKDKDIDDIETAKKDLGITENINALSSCHTLWTEYSTGKKLVDKLGKTYLTAYAYMQIKNCSGTKTVVSVSPTVRTVTSGGMGGLDIQGKEANKEGNGARVRVFGVVRNFLGIKLRDFTYVGGVNAYGEKHDF